MNLEKTIKEASQILKNNKINSYDLDAHILLSDIMGVTKEFLIVNNHLSVSENVRLKYIKLNLLYLTSLSKELEFILDILKIFFL